MIKDVIKSIKTKNIILQILAVGFLLFVIFYPGSRKQANNPVAQSPEATVLFATPSPAVQEQTEKLNKEKIEADFNKKYGEYLSQQKIPLDIKNKSWQVIGTIEPELIQIMDPEPQAPYSSYKIDTVEFRVYQYTDYATLEIYNKGEKYDNLAASPPNFHIISGITVLKHGGDRYIFLENWTGGMHCCQEEYIFKLDGDNNLKAIELLFLMDERLTSEKIIIKNDYLYLKLLDFRFRYFHASFAGSPVFYQYLIIDGDQFIIRNGDFKEEYIKQAKIDQWELDKYLKNTKIEDMKFYDWSPFLVQQTVNYLMAGEPEKAWSEFDSYFQKFSTVSPTSLKDFDSYLTGYSGENNVLLDQFKLEIKQLMTERDF